VIRDLVRRFSYFGAPRVASELRRRWTVFRNPHCDIRFEGPVYCGPGFSVFAPEGGTLVVGPGVEFRRNFRVELHKGASLHVGGGTVFTYDVLVQCSSSIEIGERCMFGQSSIVVDGNHRFRDLDRPMLEQGYDLVPIRIDDDAVVTSKCTIIADLVKRAWIGANSVVTKPIPDYSIAAGTPAKVIEYFGPNRRGTPATAAGRSTPPHSPTPEDPGAGTAGR
jgi:acetyltransferase-like isoleucine patch superfamily enzyme